MRKQLEKMLKEAEDTHTKNAAVYRKALKEKGNVEKKLRKACDVASESANELAAVNAAINSLPPTPVKAVK